MKNLLLLGFLTLMASCASTMPGTDLKINSPFISGTIKENSDFSSEKIKMYQVSLKNYGQDWITIDSALLNNAPKSQLLVGDKISSWIEACTLEKRVSDYNTSLALGALAVGGAVVGSASNSTTISNVGYITAVGAIGASGIKELVESKNKADFQAVLPEGHMFRPFMIPPMKAVQRWILIEQVRGERPEIILTSKDKKIGSVTFPLLFTAEPPKDDFSEETKR